MANRRKFTPSIEYHPGVTLSEKLKEMDMSVKEFAVRTSKPEKTIFAIIGGKSSVTPDMAIAFESVTKIPAHFWLNIQVGYDEYVARKNREEHIEDAYAWAKKFPLANMMSLGWIPVVRNIEDKVQALLSFFQVSTHKAWEDYYINQQLKVAFRISLSNTKEPHAISAWLRRGEIQAADMKVSKFSSKSLREAIPKMKNICAKQPEGFGAELQEVCASVGIKLIYTQCLPKAPINGSTRWISGIPCVQMTGRQKRNDVFWFTFFHEIGHILLHGKKDIFLEDSEACKQKDKEEEADAFASHILLPQTNEDEIIKNGNFAPEVIRMYAEKFNVHPGIIVGRLQHKGIIPFSVDSDMIAKIDIFA